MKRKYRVTYDSQNGNTFDVYINNHDVRKFYESDTRLYYSDMRYRTDRDANVLVNTVSENKTKYDHRSYLRAKEARRIQDIVGFSDKQYRQVVKKN